MNLEEFEPVMLYDVKSGKEAVAKEFENQTLKTLSRLYQMLCNCRKNEKELKQLLNPKAHLEDCPYRIRVEPIGIEFKEG